MNPNSPGDPADMVARVALHNRRVHRAVVARIWELFDGGLNDAEVARVTGYPVHLVRVVLRGGDTGVNKLTPEKRKP